MPSETTVSLDQRSIEQICARLLPVIIDTISKTAGVQEKRWLTLSEAMKVANVKSRKKMVSLLDAGIYYGYKRQVINQDGSTGSRCAWIVDRQSIDDAHNRERLLL